MVLPPGTKLSTLEDIEKAYEKLNQQEDVLNKQLETCVSRMYSLESKLRNITKSLPKLQSVCLDADNLNHMVDNTATLAETVSDKVRRLNLTRSRVSDCQKRVQDLVDIQLCSEGVSTALKNEDYEKAAAHIQRFLSIDKSLVKQTADDVADDMNNMNVTFDQLEQLRSNLTGIVSSKFDKAVKGKDFASVERFFKIYPMLDLHEEGIRKYSQQHLALKLRQTCNENINSALEFLKTDKGMNKPNVIFADTMTLLLEGAAQVIQTHELLVRTYYGPHYLVHLVMYLLAECDELTERVIGLLISMRDVEGKMQYIRGKKLEPKDKIDTLLGEFALVLSKTDLFFHFIKKKIIADGDTKDIEATDKLIKESVMFRKMKNIEGYYIEMEKFYMSVSFDKAVEMDKPEEGSITTLIVDDVFYILKKCIRRACSSSSLAAVCDILKWLCDILRNRYCHLLNKKLKKYPSNYEDLVLSFAKLQTSNEEMSFLAYLNNADVSREYTDTLRDIINSDVVKTFPQMSSEEAHNFTVLLSGLTEVSTQLTISVLQPGMKKLRESVITPRMKPWFQSFPRDNYKQTSDTAFETSEEFVHHLIAEINKLLIKYKALLTPKNYEILVSDLTTELTKHMEREVLLTSFNRMGGLVLDKEIRMLMGFFTSSTSWLIRDKFARLSHISALLNLESISELHEWQSSVDAPVLDDETIRKVLRCRDDFKPSTTTTR